MNVCWFKILESILCLCMGVNHVHDTLFCVSCNLCAECVFVSVCTLKGHPGTPGETGPTGPPGRPVSHRSFAPFAPPTFFSLGSVCRWYRIELLLTSGTPSMCSLRLGAGCIRENWQTMIAKRQTDAQRRLSIFCVQKVVLDVSSVELTTHRLQRRFLWAWWELAASCWTCIILSVKNPTPITN